MPTLISTPTQQYQATSASCTFSHTVPATGGNRALWVFVAAFNGGGGSITGVTYNSVAMTKVGSTFGTISTSGIAEQYILVNPSTGSNNVVISASGTLSEIIGIAAAFSDVNQATPTSGDTGATGSSTAPSLTLTVTGSDIGIGGVEFFNSAINDPTESDTLIAETAAGAATTGFSAQYGDGSLSWSLTGAASSYSTVGCTLVHDAAGPDITAQPQSVTSYEGQTATFTISATASAGSLSYQWKDDGSNVGTDSNSYTTGSAVYADNGSQITCVVTDSNGSKTSDAATWNVLMAAKPFYLKA